MEAYDNVMDAAEIVLGWNLSDDALADALWMEACAMARVAPEESTQSSESCS